MDYGKFAYLKSEDNSKRIAALEKQGVLSLSCIKMGVILNKDITGGYESSDIRFYSSSQSVTLILKLKLEHALPQSPQITLNLNGMPCYFDNGNFAQGINDYFIFTAAKAANGTNILKLFLNGEGYIGKLIGYDAVIWGNAVTGYEEDKNIQLIARDGLNTVCALIGDKICCYQSQTSQFDFGTQPLILGEATNFSICAGGNNAMLTAMAIVRPDGTLQFLTLGGIKIDIDIDVSACALIAADENFILCYIKSGLAYYRLIYPSLEVSHECAVDLPPSLETVTAIYDAPRPILLFKTTDGKIYLKTAAKLNGIAERLSCITMSVTPSSVIV